MQVSVITPSIRPLGLDIVRKALQKQTVLKGQFEWLICSKEDPKIDEAIWIPDTFKGGFWGLNRAYNALFKKAQGELIVTLQDWIYAPPDGIQKFVDQYEATKGKAIISGVGDQYESVDKFGRPQIKIWLDPRKSEKFGSFYECYPNDAEWNWCVIPRKAVFDIGGMDEQLDFLGYGGDQLQVVQRMGELGYKFYLDQTNESYTIRHDRSDFGGQKNWDANHVIFNGKYDARVRQLKTEGKWPKLDYLK